MLYKTKLCSRFVVFALIGLVFAFSFFSLACRTKAPSSPDEIIFPAGFILAENHADYCSYLMFIEHPDFHYIAGHPDPRFPQEVNDYLEKMHKIAPLFEQYELSRQGRVLPIHADGQDMILVVCPKAFDKKLTLYDSNLNVLDTNGVYGDYYQYFATANFRDRLWVLAGDGGNQGYMVMYEIKIAQGGQMDVRRISDGDRYFQDTYKIIHPATNPEMAIHQRKETFEFYRYYILLYLFLFALTIMAFYSQHKTLILCILAVLFLLALWKFLDKYRNKKKKKKNIAN